MPRSGPLSEVDELLTELALVDSYLELLGYPRDGVTRLSIRKVFQRKPLDLVAIDTLVKEFACHFDWTCPPYWWARYRRGRPLDR